MRLLKALLLAFSLCLPGTVWAQRSPVVVELFTSQGCSACPPANAILAKVAQRPDVIALALHVNYWDYLGWKDTFGKAAHTLRQRAYAKAMRKRSVYTPQMIVQGVDHGAGASYEEVVEAVVAHQGRPALVDLKLERRGRLLRIRLAPLSPAGVGASDVYMVRFLTESAVTNKDGENAGQQVNYVNVVTDWSTVAQWDGRLAAEIAVEVPEGGQVAVIVQRERLGPILSAAKLP